MESWEPELVVLVSSAIGMVEATGAMALEQVELVATEMEASSKLRAIAVVMVLVATAERLRVELGSKA